MISGWLLKVLIGFAIAGVLAFEVGSPLVVRGQVDGAAHDTAEEAAFELGNNGTLQQVQGACARIADLRDVRLEQCEVVQGETRPAVRVTVSKAARSVFLKRFSFAKDWYDVEVTATQETPK
jgi:hypothetical protein